MAVPKTVNRTDPIVIVNDAHEFNLSFTVENFSDITRELGHVISPIFGCKSDNHCGAKWMLEVWPHGNHEKHKDHFGIFLKLHQAPERLLAADILFEVAIIAGNLNRLKSQKMRCGLDQIVPGCGWYDFISRQQMLDNSELYLTDGHLRLECSGKAFFRVRPLPGKSRYFREMPYSRRELEPKLKYDIDQMD